MDRHLTIAKPNAYAEPKSGLLLALTTIKQVRNDEVGSEAQVDAVTHRLVAAKTAKRGRFADRFSTQI